MTDRPVRGLHAGALVLLGVFALNAGNYLFHLIAARHIGPARYGDLATLIAISGLISLPLGGVQVWVARSVAQYRAVGDDEAIQWFTRRVGRYLIVIGAIATLVLLALTTAIQSVLGIASVAAVAITALTAFPAIVSSVSWGLAQGLERFGLVSLTYAAGPVARIGFTLIAFVLGARWASGCCCRSGCCGTGSARRRRPAAGSTAAKRCARSSPSSSVCLRSPR
jgi:O-antigen/teichoic acid export membrane protein